MRSRRRHASDRRGGSPLLRVLAPLLIGLVATLATSTVAQRTVARYADIDACVTGCDVAAAGWPLPYLVDYPGLSPANEASLSGAAIRVDRLRPEALAVDLALWTVLSAVLLAVLRRSRR